MLVCGEGDVNGYARACVRVCVYACVCVRVRMRVRVSLRAYVCECGRVCVWMRVWRGNAREHCENEAGIRRER